jgi:hypothetical protein
MRDLSGAATNAHVMKAGRLSYDFHQDPSRCLNMAGEFKTFSFTLIVIQLYTRNFRHCHPRYDRQMTPPQSIPNSSYLHTPLPPHTTSKDSAICTIHTATRHSRNADQSSRQALLSYTHLSFQIICLHTDQTTALHNTPNRASITVHD